MRTRVAQRPASSPQFDTESYAQALRRPVQIIAQGVIAVDTDPCASSDGAVRHGRLLTAKERRKKAELRAGGASFRETGRSLNRSYSHSYSVLGGSEIIVPGFDRGSLITNE